MSVFKLFAAHKIRSDRRAKFCPESLEGRNLLSGAVASLPPADVAPVRNVMPTVGVGQGVVTPGTPTFKSLGLDVPVTYSGTALIAPLGRVTIVGHHDSYPTIIGVYPNGNPMISGDTIANGSLTITTTNGEQLILSYTGSGVQTSTESERMAGLNKFQDQFDYTITGGTGRFAGASGKGVINALDLTPNASQATVHQEPFIFEITGLLSTVGSNKHS